MIDYLYKTKPFKHQEDVFLTSREKEYYALLMEQGTGKSKIIVDSTAYLFATGRIDSLLVVAPNGVQRNWVINEMPTHCPDYIDYKAAWYSSSPNKKEEENLCAVIKHQGLKVVVMNVEAFATEKGVNFAKKWLISFRTMMVIDESSVIKNPKAIRTKNLLKLSVHAKYRRILTGTPITQGPLDLYTQFAFLDSQILRCQSYFAFRNRYAIMKEIKTAGKSFQVIVDYQNTEELINLIQPYSYRVTKKECLDLPDKVYTKRYVQLSDQQKKLYNTLKKEMLSEFNGMIMSAPLALTKIMRLQQIVGGFFVPDSDINDQIYFEDDSEVMTIIPNTGLTSIPHQSIDKVNPRIESLIELLEETNGKVIIFARFIPEIQAIIDRITEVFGSDSYVEYTGRIKDNTIRSENIRKFQEDDNVRFFIGNKAAAYGLTLTAASTVVYYSNTFSLDERLQNEDRAHRIGQKNNVLYVDMIAENTLDEHIVKALRSKKEIADIITGDDIRNWI